MIGGSVVTGGLLAVHTHPDDETLATGALIAAWAQSGAPVRLVTCTRGEQGEVIGPALAHLEGSGEQLAAHREGELAQAVAALGVTEQFFLDQLPVAGQDAPAARIEDSGMAWLPGQNSGTAAAAQTIPDGAFVGVDLDEAAARLAGLMDVTRPDVVVTYDPGGGYGHPDHVRTHEVTMRALDVTEHARPLVLWASVTPEALREQRRQLARAPWAHDLAQSLGLTFPDPDADLPSIADDSRPTAVSVCSLSVLPAVTAALRAHATQVHALHVPEQVAEHPDAILGCYSLSNNVLAPISPAETYAWGTPASMGRSAEFADLTRSPHITVHRVR